jgi:hypothetical protein
MVETLFLVHWDICFIVVIFRSLWYLAHQPNSEYNNQINIFFDYFKNDGFMKHKTKGRINHKRNI